MSETPTEVDVLARKPLTEHDLAARYGLHVNTVRNWRRRGEGPPWFKAGRFTFYAWPGIERFEAGGNSRTTALPPPAIPSMPRRATRRASATEVRLPPQCQSLIAELEGREWQRS